MIKNIKFISIIIVGTIMINCFSKTELQEKSIVNGNNKDLTVYGECVKSKNGFTVGFRINIKNNSLKNDLILKVLPNYVTMFDIIIFNNKKSYAINLIKDKLEFIDNEILENSENSEYVIVDSISTLPPPHYGYTNIIIFPKTTLSIFVPIPKDIIKEENGNIKDKIEIIPSGKYKIETMVSIGYFTLKTRTYFTFKRDIDKLSKEIEVQSVTFSSKNIPIVIDNKLLDEDIERIYNESLKNKP